MTSGKSDIIDVTLEFRMEKGGAIGFFQGELDDAGDEVWVWLPKSQIEWEKGSNEVSMPEWLAKEKRLI